MTLDGSAASRAAAVAERVAYPPPSIIGRIVLVRGRNRRSRHGLGHLAALATAERCNAGASADASALLNGAAVIVPG